MSTPSRGPGPGAAPGPDPELIVPLVQACPTVAGLHGGAFGEVATYLPGRRVRGIRVTGDGVEIHVVGRYPAAMAEIAAQVRAAVIPVTGALPVHLTVADLALPGDPDLDDAIVHDPLRSATAAANPSGATPSAATPGNARIGVPAFPQPPTEAVADPDSRRAPADRLDPKEPAR